MDVEKFVLDRLSNMRLEDSWTVERVTNMIRAAIAQDREEREADPLAAKLEALAGKWKNHGHLSCLLGTWYVDLGGPVEDRKICKGSTPLAAVDAALEEVTDAD